MSNQTDSSTSGGIGFLGALTIVFIVLKLTNTINWSWWWVLSPLWIPVALVALLFVGALIYYRVFKRTRS